MKIAFITRSTLYAVPGGDTVQVVQTAKQLAFMEITADIKLTNDYINYSEYDLLHFFNLIRPADILYHSYKAKKPFVVSTILCDYSEFDQQHRKGLGRVLRYLSADGAEYIKTIARFVFGRDRLASFTYAWKGQRNSIIDILNRAALILPNSGSEYQRVSTNYPSFVKHAIIPNGVDENLFNYDSSVVKDDKLVICAARIEGIKNQLNLIKALNNTPYRLLIIGKHAPNQAAYYKECQDIAAKNITFIEHLPQKELVKYYQQAKVHVLPSWFETTGLSSLEAALMGCSIVISDKGDVRDYFSDNAFYCDPASPQSILAAITQASQAPVNNKLRDIILQKYTWKQAAKETLKAYQSVI